jgi:FAD dependent oxidoreductase
MPSAQTRFVRLDEKQRPRLGIVVDGVPISALAGSCPCRRTIVCRFELRTDVIVVGGGIMGAATAFYLRKRGRTVSLIERGLIGQQASGVNFGNVRRQGRYLPQLPLANRSREIWGRLDELLGEDAEFLPSGRPAGVRRLLIGSTLLWPPRPCPAGRRTTP